jgi:hypothetical protein
MTQYYVTRYSYFNKYFHYTIKNINMHTFIYK